MSELPQKYRPKGDEVTALKWDGTDESTMAIVAWSSGLVRQAADGKKLVLGTPEGWLPIAHGDYVIKSTNGVFSAMQSASFERRYEISKQEGP